MASSESSTCDYGSLSSILSSLGNESRNRYVDKIKEAGIRDPYTLPAHLFMPLHCCSFANLPNLQYLDVFNYLINTTSRYTSEQFKAYKSLDAYKYFVAGHVRSTGVWEIPEKDRFLVMSKVTHSQLLNDPLLQAWVVIQRDGIVQSCHCTCMAGLSECCSHVAAILFAVETAVRVAEGQTCTDVTCKWLNPSTSKTARYAEVSEIDFTSPKQKRKRLGEEAEKINRPVKHIPFPTPQEKAQFYKALSESGSNSAILSILPEYCDNFVPRSIKKQLPKPLSALHKAEYENLGFQELLSKSNDNFRAMSLSPEQVVAVEEETREQAASSVWYQQRAGRVTASNFRAFTHTSILNPSRSVIQKICYPESFKFSTQATRYDIFVAWSFFQEVNKNYRWGCQHEKTAFEVYKAFQSSKHSEFDTKQCGFFICKDLPHIGASPDGIISCTCCGAGCLEIKCPHCLTSTSLETASQKKSFCLQQDVDGNYSLRKDHQYYFQVQMQMKVCNLNYCDFVVWSQDTIVIECINIDTNFLDIEIGRANILYVNIILPELLGKWYSRSHPTAEPSLSKPDDGSVTNNVTLWCYCRSADDGTMIICMGEKCAIKQFHKNCTGLKHVPKKWMCVDCGKTK